MPAFLHFYQGGVTRDEFWRLPRREYVRLTEFMQATRRNERAEMERLKAQLG